MLPTRNQKITLLLSLYFAQGLPFGFFTQALPSVMRDLRISLEVVGLSTLVALPWALKFSWASWVDSGGLPTLGRRRGWIIPLQLAMIATLFLTPVAYLMLARFATPSAEEERRLHAELREAGDGGPQAPDRGLAPGE